MSPPKRSGVQASQMPKKPSSFFNSPDRDGLLWPPPLNGTKTPLLSSHKEHHLSNVQVSRKGVTQISSIHRTSILVYPSAAPLGPEKLTRHPLSKLPPSLQRCVPHLSLSQSSQQTAIHPKLCWWGRPPSESTPVQPHYYCRRRHADIPTGCPAGILV